MFVCFCLLISKFVYLVVKIMERMIQKIVAQNALCEMRLEIVG